MWETRETALLHVACGNTARRRYGIGAKFSCISSLHAYSYIQQSGRNLQTMNAKNRKKSPIRENADANITCHFGDGDISRYRSRFTHTHTHTHTHTDRRTHMRIASSIIVRMSIKTTIVHIILTRVYAFSDINYIQPPCVSVHIHSSTVHPGDIR